MTPLRAVGFDKRPIPAQIQLRSGCAVTIPLRTVLVVSVAESLLSVEFEILSAPPFLKAQRAVSITEF
jgi:hypothetical protein